MSAIVKVEHLTYVYNHGMPDASHCGWTRELRNGRRPLRGYHRGHRLRQIHPHYPHQRHEEAYHRQNVYRRRDMWEDPEKTSATSALSQVWCSSTRSISCSKKPVYKDIAFGPKNMGLSADEIDRRVQELPSLSALTAALCSAAPLSFPAARSAGVAVAGVLAMKPRLLVLDETAAGLDPEGRDEILSRGEGVP